MGKTPSGTPQIKLLLVLIMAEEETVQTPNKIVLIGDEGVGKTTIFARFMKGQFVDSDGHTKSMAEHRKELTTESGKKVQVRRFEYI